MFQYFGTIYKRLKNAIVGHRYAKECNELVNVFRKVTPLNIADINQIQKILRGISSDPLLLDRKFAMIREAFKTRQDMAQNVNATDIPTRYEAYISDEFKKIKKRKIDKNRDVSYRIGDVIFHGDVHSSEEQEYFAEQNVAMLNAEPLRPKICGFGCEETTCPSCIEKRIRKELEIKMEIEQKRIQMEREERRFRAGDCRVINSLNEKFGLPFLIGRSIADDNFNIEDLETEDREALLEWKARIKKQVEEVGPKFLVKQKEARLKKEKRKAEKKLKKKIRSEKTKEEAPVPFVNPFFKKPAATENNLATEKKDAMTIKENANDFSVIRDSKDIVNSSANKSSESLSVEEIKPVIPVFRFNPVQSPLSAVNDAISEKIVDANESALAPIGEVEKKPDVQMPVFSFKPSFIKEGETKTPFIVDKEKLESLESLNKAKPVEAAENAVPFKNPFFKKTETASSGISFSKPSFASGNETENISGKSSPFNFPATFGTGSGNSSVGNETNESASQSLQLPKFTFGSQNTSIPVANESVVPNTMEPKNVGANDLKTSFTANGAPSMFGIPVQQQFGQIPNAPIQPPVFQPASSVGFGGNFSNPSTPSGQQPRVSIFNPNCKGTNEIMNLLTKPIAPQENNANFNSTGLNNAGLNNTGLNNAGLNMGSGFASLQDRFSQNPQENNATQQNAGFSFGSSNVQNSFGNSPVFNPSSPFVNQSSVSPFGGNSFIQPNTSQSGSSLYPEPKPSSIAENMKKLMAAGNVFAKPETEPVSGTINLFGNNNDEESDEYKSINRRGSRRRY
ncbi:hypothetical protein ENBRE01_1868 [Enteropsectra breve]|nr:hypothetical protein ENBRE01_1868 [Enteropsectra breve]